MPSQASAYRELRYMNDFTIFGWANDYQLPVLSSLSGCILLFCWTIYAFNFKPSDTTWWKKLCKLLAYIILSFIILGFQLHSFYDLLIYAIIFFIIVLLLKLARVRPKTEQQNNIQTDIKEKHS